MASTVDLNTCSVEELKEMVLNNWHQLNKVMDQLDELTIYRCLVIELSGRKNTGIVGRLHTRFMMLRKRDLHQAILAFIDEAKENNYDTAAVEARLADFYRL